MLTPKQLAIFRLGLSPFVAQIEQEFHPDSLEVFINLEEGFRTIYSYGPSKISEHTASMGLTAFIAQTKSMFFMKGDNSARAIQFPFPGQEFRSIVECPLMHRGQVVGVVALTKLQDKDFDDSTLQGLEQIVGQVSGLFHQVLLPSSLELFIDPGDAPAEKISELLTELSNLYRMIGGSGINFVHTKIGRRVMFQ